MQLVEVLIWGVIPTSQSTVQLTLKGPPNLPSPLLGREMKTIQSGEGNVQLVRFTCLREPSAVAQHVDVGQGKEGKAGI